MIESIESAMNSGDNGEDYFDATDMHARILLGVPPYSKLTSTLIVNKVKANDNLSRRIRSVTGKLTGDSIRSFFEGLPRNTEETDDLYSEDVELANAWDYLNGKVVS